MNKKDISGLNSHYFNLLSPKQKYQVKNKILKENEKEIEVLIDKFSLEYLYNDGLMTFEEISKELNLPLNSVVTSYRRGMLKLKRYMKGLEL